MASLDGVRITNVGDTAFNVEFGAIVDRAINARVMSLYDAIKRRQAGEGLAGLVEIIPTFRSLQVSYDPRVSSRAAIEEAVWDLLKQAGDRVGEDTRTWRIPVCYDGELGPDVDDICQACSLSRDEMIALHSNAEYFVYMIGFMPGFAYMGGVPEPLRQPRRLSPRVKVPAGSVAIAEELSAVYPWESPGGVAPDRPLADSLLRHPARTPGVAAGRRPGALPADRPGGIRRAVGRHRFPRPEHPPAEGPLT